MIQIRLVHTTWSTLVSHTPTSSPATQRYHERRHQPVSYFRRTEDCQSGRRQLALTTSARSRFRTVTSHTAARSLLISFFFEHSHGDTRPTSNITIPGPRAGILYCLQWHFAEPGTLPDTITITLSIRKQAGSLQSPPESPAINASSTPRPAADAASYILGLSWAKSWIRAVRRTANVWSIQSFKSLRRITNVELCGIQIRRGTNANINPHRSYGAEE